MTQPNTTQPLIRSARSFVSPIGLALMLAGCAADLTTTEEELELGTTESAIIGGTNITEAQNVSPFNSVVRIAEVDNGLLGDVCTATKIGVHQYLTAAHCIENTFPGGQIAITNAASGDLGPPFYTVTFSFVHPSYALYKAVASLSSENAYDVGVFTINTSLPYPSRPLPGSGYVGTNTQGVFVGYGSFNKRRGNMTAAAQGSTSLPRFTRYFQDFGNPTGQTGDSGGPVFSGSTATSSSSIIGITAAGLAGSSTTFFARTGNVYRWIQNPHLLSQSIVANGALGFLVNASTGQCIGESGNPLVAGTYECDGRSQPTDNQYWKLVANGSYYRVQNTRHLTSSGTPYCLQANSSTTAIDVAPCSTSAFQDWQFVTSSGGFNTIRPRQFSSRCMIRNSNGSIGQSTSCSGNASRWVFHR